MAKLFKKIGPKWARFQNGTALCTRFFREKKNICIFFFWAKLTNLKTYFESVFYFNMLINYVAFYYN